MHVLSVHYVTIFLFLVCFLTPPLLFVTFFLVTLTTASNSSLNLWISYKKKNKKNLGGGGEILKINLGRTCFDRVGRKSETNNIFFQA